MQQGRIKTKKIELWQAGIIKKSLSTVSALDENSALGEDLVLLWRS